jgi:HAD superfamily hydrolase (TIGR01509 family)
LAVDVILFDVDGTLVDTVDLHAQAWVETLAHYGVAADFADLRSQIGKGGDQILDGLLPPALASRAQEIDDHREQLYKRDYLPKAKVFPGVRELFEAIRARGQRAYLATSGKDEVEHYLRLAGIERLVGGMATSDDVERSKPYPDIFAAAARKAGVTDPRRAVAVGDTPYDAEAARAAGFACVGVLCGGFPENDLRAAGAVAIYRDPADLLARLDSSPLA